MKILFILVVNTKNDTIKQIDNCCTEIYETKLKALSMISERDHSQKSRECILNKNNDNLKELNNYIPNLLKYLWEHPKLVSILLSNSDTVDIKDNLAPLIVNNFYENILSSNYIEDNLMYVLALMLKEEINKLENINDSELFLNNRSSCGYLLGELRRKNDVQYFFKTLLLNVINDLEVISSKTFNLDIQKIRDNFKKQLKDKECKNKASSIKNNKSINTEYLYKKQIDMPNDSCNLNYEELQLKQYTEKEKAKLDEFSEKYMPILSFSEIKKMMKESYINDNNMKNYCNNQLINCKNVKDENYYSNKKFMESLYKMNESRDVLYLYQNSFSSIIDFIGQILTNLKNNLYLLPYSVKCLCKIISILIEKKFPTINATQKNAYIADFFFKKLLIPILANPGVGLLINNFIISDNTLKNLKIINEVLGQLVSGKFYRNNENSDYSSFNWYFLEKMPEILEIFEKLTKVTLPHFIEELLYDKLDRNYQYDYFRENPNEVMYHRSICFNLSNINSLLNSMEKCQNKIFINDIPGNIFKKTFEKLNSTKNRKLINDLIKNSKDMELDNKDIKTRKSVKPNKDKDNNNTNVKEKIHYFLITSLIANDKYKELFNFQLDKNLCYTLKELKKTNDTKDIINNNVIKVKNFIISLLYNYRRLIITDFDEGTMTNTLSILKILKTYIKSSNFVVDGSIPSEWYIDSLIDYLDKIPEEFRTNDFKLLYDEIENELNIAIKKLDFEVLSICLNKLKYTKRGKNYYEEAIKSTKELELNEIVKQIIEDAYIPVEIIFKYNKEKIFDIVKSKVKEKEYLKKKIKNNDFCHNIREFTEKFPDLQIFQEKQDIDIFDLQKELCIPEKIEHYFNIIKEYLLSNEKYKCSSEIEEINNKINDHIMIKLYDKIFPKTNSKDDKIFNKSVMISWTEPKHFIAGKTNYVFDSFLPGVIDCFKSMDKEKSPRKKILYMNDIFTSISKVLKFNGGDENTGVDDQIPILNYAFVKAQPIRIDSNIKLIELYIGDMGSKKEGSQLTQLIATCDFIINLNYDNLNGVTKEEFLRKCTYAASGITPS